MTHKPEATSPQPARVVRTARLIAWLVLLLLLLGLSHSLYARWSQDRTLAARAADNARIHVLVLQPSIGAADTQLTLPGTLQGSLEAQIYARTPGYVKHWFKDIGAPVKKGERLAELDTPEVQRQVDEAAANFQLAQIAYARWTRLRAADAVSQQEMDEKTSSYRQTQAVLQRLRQQLAFGKVTAPFDGIVTRRNVNVGDLVNAGNGGTGQALFAMAQIDILHVYVYVPQEHASQIRVGDRVQILRAEQPDQPLSARIARTAGAIDLNTRTLQIDIDIANRHHTLLPGAYVEVALQPASGHYLVLPTNTLLFGAEGVQVAVVKQGRVHRQTVLLGTDYGREVEIKSGISPMDQVIVNPPDALVSGQMVTVEAVSSPTKGGA